MSHATLFPEDSAERKTFPVFSGLLQYFPSALAKVANHSFKGNEKHNPGQPLHHDRAKSDDEADALCRHLMEGDYVGMAWRALALLQKHCEANGAPVAPGARNVPALDPFDVRPGAIVRGNSKDHRRVATPAEMAAYGAPAYATDCHGELLLIGDTVRIVDPSHDDVLCGFGKGSTAKVAGKGVGPGSMVCLQGSHDTRWFHGKQIEVLPA